jgi:Haem-NO-binding
MYGLVNRALADLVETRFGAEAWERTRARAGVDTETFVSLATYPDEVTVGLVVAAADELRLGVPELLERFGEHWVGFAATHGYRELFDARGDSFFGFVAKLDELHARLALSLPQLRPPAFQSVVVDASTIRLRYVSERVGLAPFVIGLLRGLGRSFGERVSIVHERRKGDGCDHDEFLVSTA